MKLGSLGQGRASTGRRRPHAQPGRLTEALLHPCALAGSHKRSLQRFPSRSRLFQHAGRCFATKINYMKAHTRSLTDVRCRMILNNTSCRRNPVKAGIVLDHVGDDGAVLGDASPSAGEEQLRVALDLSAMYSPSTLL